MGRVGWTPNAYCMRPQSVRVLADESRMASNWQHEVDRILNRKAAESPDICKNGATYPCVKGDENK